MTTPVDERDEPDYSPHRQDYHLPGYNVNGNADNNNNERLSDEEGTVIGDHNGPTRSGSKDGSNKNAYVEDDPDFVPRPFGRQDRSFSHLTVQTAHDYHHGDQLRSVASPSQSREQSSRLGDDLQMLKIEREIDRVTEQEAVEALTLGRSRSRRDDTVDEFDIATNPIHEKTAVYKPPADPVGKFSKVVKKIHQSSFVIRWATYITPVVLILLIPLLIGALVSPAKAATVGGVELLWFMIWLEIVWLTLWAGRVRTDLPTTRSSVLLTKSSASRQMFALAHWLGL